MIFLYALFARGGYGHKVVGVGEVICVLIFGNSLGNSWAIPGNSDYFSAIRRRAATKNVRIAAIRAPNRFPL